LARIDADARGCNTTAEHKADAQMLLTLLRAAAQRHDATPCKHDDCRRCAALRARCAMCALPGCGLRRREGGKNLLHCACYTASYCGAAHQREDRRRHRAACQAQLAEREAASSDA
jgi:hypothetical protein